MAWAPIIKMSQASSIVPNLKDYELERRNFRWDAVRDQLEGLPDGNGLNIAHESIDRHATGPLANKVAQRWLSRTGEVRDFTYARLHELTNRFANVLMRLGVRPDDRVYVLAGRIPELYIAALGTLKARCVFCPLFAAFGPEPIRARLAIGRGRVLVTTDLLYERKVRAMRSTLPALEHVLIVPSDGTAAASPEDNTMDFRSLMAEASAEFVIPPTDPEDQALLHFTSGTTGTPKGAIHVHGAVAAHYITGKLALDLHAEDIFWCTADPGWVTGTSYGIIAPLTSGVTSIIDEGDFDAERWYGILANQQVSVWYTAPTAIRTMMKVALM